jgi:DNA-binding Xre family transcriptional regulator
MRISYEPFFKIMQAKGISTYALFKMGFSDRTYYRIKEGKSIKTDTIVKLCELLECDISDIIKLVKE